MVLIPGGTFRMGSGDFYPDERPVHEREVASFEIDRYQVTNAQYAEFVDATGYITVAERPLDPAAFPDADPKDLVPGSTVFTPTAGPTDLRNWRKLRFPKLFNLRTDPFERADITSNTYWDWVLDHIFLFIPAQAYVANMLHTLAEFPARQESASFTITQVMAKLQSTVGSS
ncbi:Serine/threonine-protein kinase pkn1 [Microbacterium sp. Bi98]|nr:hypothetical protein ASE34_03195 [Microbacterium sp. Root280D1]CAH0202276.1 Serine/threonine-protein kinase pkn1 [Microbacterium sp. Bi98]